MSQQGTKQRKWTGERGAVEILEEAIQLLRTAPAASIAVYLAGAIPFFVALLYFWTDMARNPFAAERLAGESLAVAALFLWKSVRQAVFEARLYRQLSLTEEQPMRLARLVMIQSALQPLSLLAIPIASLAVVPFAWTVAFFRNAGLFAALGEPRVIAAARRQAGLWSPQNWFLLTLTSLAGLLLFLNVLISIVLAPQLGKSILGMEGDFARLGVRLLNSTTLAVAASIMWLAIDPLLDAVYVLRCFHGESLATGEDLRVALQRAVRAAAVALPLLAVFLRRDSKSSRTVSAGRLSTTQLRMARVARSILSGSSAPSTTSSAAVNSRGAPRMHPAPSRRVAG